MAVNNDDSYPPSNPKEVEHLGAETTTAYGELTAIGFEPGLADVPSICPPAMFNPYFTGQQAPIPGVKIVGLDRQDIIKRKKAASRPGSPELERRRSPLLRLADRPSTHERSESTKQDQNNAALGIEIERPRSALHRGDFRDQDHDQVGGSFGDFSTARGSRESTPLLATSPVVPWHPSFPGPPVRQSFPQLDRATAPGEVSWQRPQRVRAASQASLASQFAFLPPTSPLAHSSRPDTPDNASRRRSRSPDKLRRHTFSPISMYRFASAEETPTSFHSQELLAPGRPKRNYYYQAHQPGRSFSPKTSSSLPQTPTLGLRRPSLSDSPLHHAPMVGSYEESILRGRMSTIPSKPLNFVAQIGVLGRGDCKASLRCPPHVSIPFPAVYYSYGGGSKPSAVHDQPSPYVGLIDLENTLEPADTTHRRRPRIQAMRTPERSRASSLSREHIPPSESSTQIRQKQKQKRRSGSPRSPPGGCYRIPQIGQLQIVIKNPNKTAVKLFLVPYDLSDMEPGSKTFIRQRSYSAGPIIDMPLSSRKNLGTDRPEAGINQSGDVHDKPMLRYLIHLHICCTSGGRYYLYKSMRVVFANRVPDGKEKLRNEIQMPDPRYSPYRPEKGHGTAQPPPRRSSLLDPQPTATEDMHWSQLTRKLAQSLPSTHRLSDGRTPARPRVTVLPTLESRPASRQMKDDVMDIDLDLSPKGTSIYSPLASPISPRSDSIPSPEQNIRPLADPFEFERGLVHERSVYSVRSESLLSRRLMNFALEREARQNRPDGAPE